MSLFESFSVRSEALGSLGADVLRLKSRAPRRWRTGSSGDVNGSLRRIAFVASQRRQERWEGRGGERPPGRRGVNGRACPPQADNNCSFSTEYSANGSFFRPHTRSVHGNLRGRASGSRLSAIGRERGIGSQSASVLEFLMVKLLRAYGECLGAKRR